MIRSDTRKVGLSFSLTKKNEVLHVSVLCGEKHTSYNNSTYNLSTLIRSPLSANFGGDCGGAE